MIQGANSSSPIPRASLFVFLPDATATTSSKTWRPTVSSGVPSRITPQLMSMATELRAARLLVYSAARLRDSGATRVTLESAMAKLFATEVAHRVVDQAVQIHGGAGVLRGSPIERLYRAVRAPRIYEGTSEIQRLIIARQLLREADGAG